MSDYFTTTVNGKTYRAYSYKGKKPGHEWLFVEGPMESPGRGYDQEKERMTGRGRMSYAWDRYGKSSDFEKNYNGRYGARTKEYREAARQLLARWEELEPFDYGVPAHPVFARTGTIAERAAARRIRLGLPPKGSDNG